MYMRATWDLHGTYMGFTWDPCRTNMYVLHKDLHGIRMGSHGSYMGSVWDHMGATWELHGSYMGATWELHGTTWELHGICMGPHGSYMGTAWELHESYMQSAQDHLGSTRIHVGFPWTESAWEIPHTHMGSSWDPRGSIPPPPPRMGVPALGWGRDGCVLTRTLMSSVLTNNVSWPAGQHHPTMHLP